MKDFLKDSSVIKILAEITDIVGIINFVLFIAIGVSLMKTSNKLVEESVISLFLSWIIVIALFCICVIMVLKSRKKMPPK